MIITVAIFVRHYNKIAVSSLLQSENWYNDNEVLISLTSVYTYLWFIAVRPCYSNLHYGLKHSSMDDY